MKALPAPWHKCAHCGEYTSKLTGGSGGANKKATWRKNGAQFITYSHCPSKSLLRVINNDCHFKPTRKDSYLCRNCHQKWSKIEQQLLRATVSRLSEKHASFCRQEPQKS